MKRFKHYKGGVYEYMFAATHSETEEKLAIYKDEKDNIFARPYDMFFGSIEIDGKIIPRFKELEDCDDVGAKL